MCVHRVSKLIAVIPMVFVVGLSQSAMADLFVSSNPLNSVLRYSEITGAFIDAFVPGNAIHPGEGGLDHPMGLAFGPDGNLYVSSQGQIPNRGVIRYNGTTGQYLDLFASVGNGYGPRGLAFGPNGNLFVASTIASVGAILQFNQHTGSLIGAFTSGAMLDVPEGITFGPDGNLYVVDGAVVRRFDGNSGNFIDNFVTEAESSNDRLYCPAFGPDGKFYVSASARGIKRFDALGNYTGTIAQVDAYGLAFGPDGRLYVSNSPYNKVVRYNSTSGQFEDFAVSGSGDADTLAYPTYLAFSPAIPGDFDSDGDVDGADFVIWQTNFPAAGGHNLATGDADDDGDVDGTDFVIWQTHFPTTPTSGISSVPEPTSIILLLIAIVGFKSLRRLNP